MSSSLTAGTGATAGAEAEVTSFTETADGCCIRGGRERRGFEAMRERGREMRLKLAAKTNSRPSFWVSVLSCKRASVNPTRARAPRVVPSHFTREAHRINGIHRKRERTVGMARPLRRDDEEEEDAASTSTNPRDLYPPTLTLYACARCRFSEAELNCVSV